MSVASVTREPAIGPEGGPTVTIAPPMPLSTMKTCAPVVEVPVSVSLRVCRGQVAEVISRRLQCTWHSLQGARTKYRASRGSTCMPPRVQAPQRVTNFLSFRRSTAIRKLLRSSR